MTADNTRMRTIPRMRTTTGIVAELKKLDPDTNVTENLVRQLVKSDAVPVVWAGSKALINLDDILELFQLGTSRPEREPETEGGIRRLDAKRP